MELQNFSDDDYLGFAVSEESERQALICSERIGDYEYDVIVDDSGLCIFKTSVSSFDITHYAMDVGYDLAFKLASMLNANDLTKFDYQEM